MRLLHPGDGDADVRHLEPGAGRARGRHSAAGGDALGGNLCLFTGYRPLEETPLSFANDTPVRDPLLQTPVGCYDGARDSFVAAQAPISPAVAWRPSTMGQLLQAWGAQAPHSALHLVSGHTGWGVYGATLSALQNPDTSSSTAVGPRAPVLHLRGVTEIHAVTRTAGVLTVGSGVTLARPIATLDEATARHLIAGQQVRNMVSVGGNLMLARGRARHRHSPVQRGGRAVRAAHRGVPGGISGSGSVPAESWQNYCE